MSEDDTENYKNKMAKAFARVAENSMENDKALFRLCEELVKRMKVLENRILQLENARMRDKLDFSTMN